MDSVPMVRRTKAAVVLVVAAALSAALLALLTAMVMSLFIGAVAGSGIMARVWDTLPTLLLPFLLCGATGGAVAVIILLRSDARAGDGLPDDRTLGLACFMALGLSWTGLFVIAASAFRPFYLLVMVIFLHRLWRGRGASAATLRRFLLRGQPTALPVSVPGDHLPPAA